MKKFLLILLAIIGTIFLGVSSFLYVLSNGNPITEFIAESTVPSYLQELGYTNEDIQSEKYTVPKHSVNLDYYHGHYEVTFKDEPKTIYYYGVKKWSHDVVQFCETDSTHSIDFAQKNSHKEESCVSMLENR